MASHVAKQKTARLYLFDRLPPNKDKRRSHERSNTNNKMGFLPTHTYIHSPPHIGCWRVRYAKDNTESGIARSSKHNWPANVLISQKRASLCTNYLGKGHSHKQCPASSCRICKQRHNTYLRRNKVHSRRRASNGRSSNSRSSSSHSSNSWSSNSRSSSSRSPSGRSSNGQSPPGSPAPRSSHHSRRPTEHSRIPISSSSKENKHSPKRESRQSQNTSLGSMHLSHRPILNKRHNDRVKR